MIGMINMKDYDYYQAHPIDCKLYTEKPEPARSALMAGALKVC
jgi:hypothetical protein